jgi:arsenate reductase-like glutaredoxin family protein
MTEDNSKDLVLIYNSEKQEDRQAKAFAESLSGYKLATTDLAHESLSKESISQLADKLNENIEDMLAPFYDDHISVHNEGLKIASRSEMLLLMENDSKIINTPILIIGNRAYRYGSASKSLDQPLKEAVNLQFKRNH